MTRELDAEVKTLFRQFAHVAQMCGCVSLAVFSVDSDLVSEEEFESCTCGFLARIGFNGGKEAISMRFQAANLRSVWVALRAAPDKRWTNEVRNWLPLGNGYRVTEFGLPLGI